MISVKTDDLKQLLSLIPEKYFNVRRDSVITAIQEQHARIEHLARTGVSPIHRGKRITYQDGLTEAIAMLMVHKTTVQLDQMSCPLPSPKIYDQMIRHLEDMRRAVDLGCSWEGDFDGS